MPLLSSSASRSIRLFPALLLLDEMASVLFDAASVWQKRTELKSHYLDGLSASADSDYHVVLVSLRALFNRAGLAAHFSAQGDVADLDLKAAPFTRAPGQAQHLAKWTQDRVHLEALLIGVLKEFLASSGDGRLTHLLTDVVTWASATAALEAAFLGTPELVLRQVGLRTTALRTAAGSFSSAVTAQDALALVARVELLLLAGSLLRDHLVRELATHTAVVAAPPAVQAPSCSERQLVHREGLRNRFLLPVFLPMPKQATSSREPQPSRSVSPPLRPRDDLVAACSTDPYDAPGVLA